MAFWVSGVVIAYLRRSQKHALCQFLPFLLSLNSHLLSPSRFYRTLSFSDTFLPPFLSTHNRRIAASLNSETCFQVVSVFSISCCVSVFFLFLYRLQVCQCLSVLLQFLLVSLPISHLPKLCFSFFLFIVFFSLFLFIVFFSFFLLHLSLSTSFSSYFSFMP